MLAGVLELSGRAVSNGYGYIVVVPGYCYITLYNIATTYGLKHGYNWNFTGFRQQQPRRKLARSYSVLPTQMYDARLSRTF